MSYTLKHADPSIPDLTMAPLTVDNKVATSLYFNGRGVPNFGEGQQTNFLQLLESFASSTPPPRPIVGQVWYNKATSALNVYDGTSWHYVAEGAIQTGVNSPGNPVIGQLWYNALTNELKAYNGTTWVFPGVATAFVSATAPANPQNGELWYDTQTRYLKIYRSSTSTWALPVDDALQYLALLM